jgi:hypothetical protein
VSPAAPPSGGAYRIGGAGYVQVRLVIVLLLAFF